MVRADNHGDEARVARILVSSQEISDPEGVANAVLVSAAPELLATLIRLREWVRVPWGADDGPENEQLINEVEAVIAKASGENQTLITPPDSSTANV